MPSPFTLSFKLPFAAAMETAARRITVLPQTYYGAVPDAARRIAWTVSGLAGLSQIQAVLDSLNAAQADGVGFSEWRKARLKEGIGLPDHRLELIFRNHAQTAYSAGHWRRFEEQARARPYLMYSAIDDARVRPAHAAMSGYIAPISDPIWDAWTPPVSWNCRCSQISLTQAQAEARGYGRQAPPPVNPENGFSHHPLDAERVAAEYFSQRAIEAGPEMVRAATTYLTRAPLAIEAPVVQSLGASTYDVLKRQVQAIADAGEPWPVGASMASLVAARAYWARISTALVNDVLRGLTSLTPENSALASATEIGMRALERYSGPVYRGVDAARLETIGRLSAFDAAHRVGQIVEWRTFTTGSTKAPYIGVGRYRFLILDAIGTTPGRWVAAESFDVALLPGARLQIVARTERNGTIYIVARYLREHNAVVRDSHRFAVDSLDLLVSDWADWTERNAKPVPPDFLERCRSEIDAGVAIPGGPDVMAEVRKMWPQLDDAVDGKVVHYGRLPSFKDDSES